MTAQVQTRARIRVTVHDSFDDPLLNDAAWSAVASVGCTYTIFQEKVWHALWWESYGRGQLAVIAVHCDGALVALAPLFIDGGMAFLVGSGNSDYLDLIGDTAVPGTTAALIGTLFERYPQVIGVRLYHVPDGSATSRRLFEAANELRAKCVEEESLVAPMLAMGVSGIAALEAAAKRSLVRHTRFFDRDASFRVRHLRAAGDIEPYLDAFFEQHERRWSGTSSPSLFTDGAHRAFYCRLVAGAAKADWLRFTVVEWQERAIAFHLGFSHRGRYLWYKPSFDAELSRRSPGEVLLRELLLEAVNEGARIFDFGLGDEPFKRRFCSHFPLVRNWGVYRKD